MSSTRLPYVEEFEAYLAQPLIASVADQPRWTVSDRDKVPINMRELLYDSPSRIHGAHRPDETCLVSRDVLVETYDVAALAAPNHAFHADITKDDPFLVLDVEKTCEPEVAKSFFDNLPWVYAERSMSGLGYHLIIPTPWDVDGHEGFLSKILSGQELTEVSEELWFDLIERKVLRDNKGRYEFLLQHYATFTFLNDGFDDAPGITERRARLALEMLRSMIAEAPAPTKVTQYLDASGNTKELTVEADRPEHIKYVTMIHRMRRALVFKPYTKTLADHDEDHSRYEFGFINHVLWLAQSAIPSALGIGGSQPSPIDENILAWVVYDIIIENIPQRPKHTETRAGLPYLLYRVKEALPKHAMKMTDGTFADFVETHNDPEDRSDDEEREDQ